MNHDLLILRSFLAVYIPVLLSPGPTFLMVTQTAISRSRRHAVYTALGISSGSTILAFLAATGMGMLIAHFAWFNDVVKFLGGAYLLYIGVKIWRQAKQPIDDTANEKGERTLSQSFMQGLATNLSNPNSLLFFATIFASLLAQGTPTYVRLVAVALICLISSCWHVVLANWFSGARMQHAYRGAKLLINRIAAGILIFIAIKLFLGN